MISTVRGANDWSNIIFGSTHLQDTEPVRVGQHSMEVNDCPLDTELNGLESGGFSRAGPRHYHDPVDRNVQGPRPGIPLVQGCRQVEKGKHLIPGGMSENAACHSAYMFR